MSCTDTSAFGRRHTGSAATGPDAFTSRPIAPKAEDYRFRSQAAEAIASYEHERVSAERMVVKSKWWLTWASFGVLVAGVAALVALAGRSEEPGSTIWLLSHYDDRRFIVIALIMTLIGIVRVIKGVFGRKALVLKDVHAEGFTLFGRRTIRWEDISRVSVAPYGNYGQVLKIHAAVDTPSYGRFHRTISVYAWQIDTDVQAIVDAIRMYRPDV